MHFGRYLLGGLTIGAGALLYGAFVEVDRLELERVTLWLPDLPESLDGYRIGFLTDFHLRDRQTVTLAERAVTAVLSESPEIVVLGGDYVSRWRPESPAMLGRVLEPLLMMEGSVVAVPGNRDYLDGDPSLLQAIFDELNIRLLRNESWVHHGIEWVGVDSANAGEADPIGAFESATGAHPQICIWHEPDLVDWTPRDVLLQLSGHTHGGQFITPWGYAPVTSRNGSRYLQGYFESAEPPLYVSRGLGTTGPPSRLFCRPEATVLTLRCGSQA